MSTPTQYVYAFAEGNRSVSALLGGKGAGLAEMTRLGLPVPPRLHGHHRGLQGLSGNRRGTARTGHRDRPCPGRPGEGHGTRARRHRGPAAGPRFSMPGMMDTILDIGLNDRSVTGLAKASRDKRFAWDSYRRLVQMFGHTVMGVDDQLFEQALGTHKTRRGVSGDHELDTAELVLLTDEFKQIFQRETGEPFPQDPAQQLTRAIRAVFDSWNVERARVYRRREHIPDDLGTAVNVQAMVFGNLGHDSGTGVAFTRDPATGERGVYGDYLPDAQGEDVVAGVRNALPLGELKTLDPAAYAELGRHLSTLEGHYRDLCDVEFTIERGTLWVLQTRVGKRTAEAAFRIAHDLREEGTISADDALARVGGAELTRLMFPRFLTTPDDVPLAHGVPASPGAAVGPAVFDSAEAIRRAAAGEDTVLVRRETTPDDLPGMIAARAVLTSRGGKTSHAAVVARGMGKVCVCGAEELAVDTEGRRFTTTDGTVVAEGDTVSVDGTAGTVHLGALPLTDSDVGHALETGASTGPLTEAEMDGLPVTIRLIDPPLHEFLPDRTELAVRLARSAHPDPHDRELLAAVERMHEQNPMLGLRGVRLGLAVPGLMAMQVRAIAEAVVQRLRDGGRPRAEIMVPLVGTVEELRLARAEVDDVLSEVARAAGTPLDCPIGTMIELPRAALTAGRIAEAADFFSFGTNDLTQTTWGLSRDDAEASFFPLYLDKGVFEASPFETIDQEGVGRLVRLAVTEGRAVAPGLKTGVCGEHGGDPGSIHFFHRAGLDYVSCSPFRIPAARLEAGRAVLASVSAGVILSGET